ncbi:D-alanyl-D-alanine carboxypeptidase [Pleomorphomonas diazotrophica]|uniref:serine-type D-Ala-D-Ala carboxypeptidase n=1 Tax=Pleomorphomonas diazotrophica TaxID=1166257 RepID=A0A1I4WL23_9HYPH|nr:D-alanyl-D-alanine carboxypeptidase family protein [Pleomorphomonas diazotrophica]PKR91022.1 D-alanyl-D-alanine carboxypeptidase [Pleomorphomonas diazotrophica]SFN14165.1 D-alanyl-D-alanine carboxypeptidase (penicillin-binding protein 5/6) [Pleomorphomonas diazotrophica]
MRGFVLPLLLVAALLSGPAVALESVAPRVALHDETTGSLLIAKDEDKPFAPANFAKLVTAAVVFEALKTGEVTETTLYPVSEHAWRTGGAPARVTTMFAAVKSFVPVGDLLRGLVVDYANDAAIALAEGLAGSEAAFTERMNAYAVRVGLRGSRFANPTGFADPEAKTTLADMLRLAGHIRTAYPDRYALYSQPEFLWNKINQTNKTRFIKELAGVDGMVLAFDEAAGFGALLTAGRGDRRVTLAASGYASLADRDKDLKALIDGAFSEYGRFEIYPPGAEIGRVKVFGGKMPDVAVVSAGGAPVNLTLPTGDRSQFRLAVVYDGPVPAPVTRGAVLARLEVRVGDRLYQSVPLEAAVDIERGEIRDRALDGFAEMFAGWWYRTIGSISIEDIVNLGALRGRHQG